MASINITEIEKLESNKNMQFTEGKYWITTKV